MNSTLRYSIPIFLRKPFFILLGLALIYLIHIFSNTTDARLNHQSRNLSNETAPSYNQQVKPLLDKRCVVCHSCYDAPCQLKLSSAEGLFRGANKEKVYNPRRLKAIEPTRLFIDAKTTNGWRNKDFHSVMNENNSASKTLLQMMLELKELQPQPDKDKLPDAFTLDLDREQQCPTHESFDDFAEEYPLWGMPYAMPNLNPNEYKILKSWLDNGAKIPKPQALPAASLAQIKKWEDFLNQPSNKHRLVSRYIFEHLFHAHIHFKNTPRNEFYRLVRSSTPAGQAIDEIATLRPYDDPYDKQYNNADKKVFYYRLLHYVPTIVAKNHILYEFSEQRMQRYQQLFFSTDYRVDNPPSYAANITSNPFKVFAALPPDSRYRFLLDDARFFIEGFVKGPVCRGQIALNVIEDQFWIVFFNPDQPIFTNRAEFLNNVSDYLRIPSERKSHLNLLPIWSDYWQRQKQYMAQKQKHFVKMNTHNLNHAMNYIWDGNGNNPNAALTVLRHFDSGSVEYGFVGNNPETTWIIDYPLFERIHYLLVAGFNIYGNLGHQLSTRIYMDFLRMEGEDHFLAFLPAQQRKKIRDSWYQGIRSELDVLFKAPMDWLNVDVVTGYQTDDVQSELLSQLKLRLGNVLPQASNINQCGYTHCPKNNSRKMQLDEAMQKIARLRGKQLHAFPEISFVRVVTDTPEQSFAYTLIRNKAYKNVISLFSDERKRNLQDIEKDSLTVIDWLAGSYPNFFFTVHINDINNFVENCTAINNQQDFERFVKHYGVRRTSSQFWETADWFQAQYAQQRPLSSGLYDLSRYSNL